MPKSNPKHKPVRMKHVKIVKNSFKKINGIPEGPLAGLNGQLMITAAHRYCLGRQSYIVSSCIEWMKQWWPAFDRNTKNCMVRDTVVALMNNEAGSKYDWVGWKTFGDWAWEKLDHEDQIWVRQAVAHHKKPWPLGDRLFDKPAHADDDEGCAGQS